MGRTDQETKRLKDQETSSAGSVEHGEKGVQWFSDSVLAKARLADSAQQEKPGRLEGKRGMRLET